MNDLISRQAAIDLVKDVCDAIMSGCDSHYDSETGDEVYNDILEVDAILKCNKEIRIALVNMPSAEPEKVLIAEVKLSKDQIQNAVNDAVEKIKAEMEVERKKGKWIGKEQFANSLEYYSWQCSVCGCVLEDPTLDKPYPFCPHCGSQNAEEEGDAE